MNANPRTLNNESPGRILVVCNDVERRASLAAQVAAAGFEVQEAGESHEAVARLSVEPFDVCLISATDSRHVAWNISSRLRDQQTAAGFVCLVDAEAAAVFEAADEATIPAVFCEVLEVSGLPKQLQPVLRGAVERIRLVRENRRLKARLSNRTLGELVGQSSAMRRLRELVMEAAESDRNVLLEGEPGTELELVAQSIHECSRRIHRPFIKLDCSVLSTASVEQALFGDRETRGLVSVGVDSEPSRLKLAAGGTLFLNNIDAMSQGLQKKLLRILREADVPAASLGGARDRLDVRLIAGSHADLGLRVEQESFCKEAYRRLGECSIIVPPLCRRREDLGLLVEHILARLAVQEGRPPKNITLEALNVLNDYPWPGNVRELQNILDRACTLDPGAKLTAEMVRPWLQTTDATRDHEPATGMTLRAMERKLIETTFARCGGNRERTAQMLNIGIRTLSGKLREYGYPPRGGPGSNLGPHPPRAA